MSTPSTTPQPSAAPTAPTGAPRRSRKKGAWRKLIPYVIGGGLLAAIVSGLIPKPIEVETATVRTAPMRVTVLEEGKTRIRHRYTISPPISGYLKRITLRAGDRITAGKTVLAAIQSEWAGFLNPRLLAETQARVKASEAAWMRTDAAVERAQAALDFAEKDKARDLILKNKGAISTKEWDAAESQVNLLGRELRAADFARQVAKFEWDQAKSTLQQTQSPAGANTEPLQIFAPVSGYVLNVQEENARIVAAGMPLMEVGDPTDLEAEIELLSSDAVGVRPGAQVSIEQWGGDKPLLGTVSVIEPGAYTKVSALGVEEQRVKVRVDFQPPAESPLGDRFRVEARILVWNAPSVRQVPTGALFRRGGDWMTFVLESGNARLTKVQIAHNNGLSAEVLSGLSEEQTVIMHPPDALTEGKAVRARQ